MKKGDENTTFALSIWFLKNDKKSEATLKK